MKVCNNFLIVLGMILLSQIVSANSSKAATPNCPKLHMLLVDLEKRISRLNTKYPDEVSFYGFHGYMVKGITYEDAGKYILQIADQVEKCEKKKKGKTCDLAAKEVIDLIRSGQNICKKNEKANCGLC